ncbi:hypothetical protein ACFL2M_02435, partial [Patescibacteria group bacterium]
LILEYMEDGTGKLRARPDRQPRRAPAERGIPQPPQPRLQVVPDRVDLPPPTESPAVRAAQVAQARQKLYDQQAAGEITARRVRLQRQVTMAQEQITTLSKGSWFTRLANRGKLQDQQKRLEVAQRNLQQLNEEAGIEAPPAPGSFDLATAAGREQERQAVTAAPRPRQEKAAKIMATVQADAAEELLPAVEPDEAISGDPFKEYEYWLQKHREAIRRRTELNQNKPGFFARAARKQWNADMQATTSAIGQIQEQLKVYQQQRRDLMGQQKPTPPTAPPEQMA